MGGGGGVLRGINFGFWPHLGCSGDTVYTYTSNKLVSREVVHRLITSLAVSHWKLRMDTYGWVSTQPSQPKQAILRTGFDFNVFFSGILQFQLVRSLTRRWTWH